MPAVLFGAEHDEFAPLLDWLTDRSRVFVVKESLPRFIALVAEASFFLCLDSFAAHVAGAVGAPVVSLHGSRYPDLSRPYGAPGRGHPSRRRPVPNLPRKTLRLEAELLYSRPADASQRRCAPRSTRARIGAESGERRTRLHSGAGERETIMSSLATTYGL